MAWAQLSPSSPFTADDILKIKHIFHSMMIAASAGGSEYIWSIPVAIPANSAATIV